jgi:hypothetical protein
VTGARCQPVVGEAISEEKAVELTGVNDTEVLLFDLA